MQSNTHSIIKSNTSMNINSVTKGDMLDRQMQGYPLWLSNFVIVYQKLSIDNLDLLATVYHQKVNFIDPIHELKGFDNLYDYFSNLYQNITACDFVIEEVIWQQSEASLFWTMTYQHPKLNKGKPVIVSGTSHIKEEDNKVIFHRDYLDLGAMLYEQLPVLGTVTKWIKTNAAKPNLSKTSATKAVN